MSDKPMWDDKQVAKFLHVALETVRKWRRTGKGPRWSKLGDLVRYDPQDVIDWRDAQPKGGRPPAPKKRGPKKSVQQSVQFSAGKRYLYGTFGTSR